MMVTGVVKSMTGESAQRAALGAGAIVMDIIATNDGRLPHEKIRRIRDLRPDMILLSGGTDGGTKTHVVELAEIIAAADPKARLGGGYELPVIYAGNKDAVPEITRHPGRQDRAGGDRQPPALHGAGEPHAGAARDPRPVHGARDGARARATRS